MAPYLELLTTGSNPVLPVNPTLLSELKHKNAEHLAKLESALQDAQTNLGETEISDALKAKASYLARIGHKVSNRYNAQTYSPWANHPPAPVPIS